MSEVIARVQFTQRFGIYNRGEVAVYPLHEATRLVMQGVAVGLPPPIDPNVPADPPQPVRQPAAVVKK